MPCIPEVGIGVVRVQFERSLESSLRAGPVPLEAVSDYAECGVCFGQPIILELSLLRGRFSV
jgi:hypothetical protein